MIDKLKRNLSPQLYYHGAHHTQDVLNAVKLIAAAENTKEEDLFLLKVAALYHDSGFLSAYKNHEDISCQIAREDLPEFGLSEQEIDIICGMIQATRIPQQPKTPLENIISDADMEYLGTDEFDRISNNLFKEVKIYLNIPNQHEWDKIQVSFLSQHHYYTDFCRKNREPEKQKHLNEVKARL